MKQTSSTVPRAPHRARTTKSDQPVGPGTHTVDLALRMLDHLAASREPLGVTDLARAFDASKATVYRHLRTLVRHGFVRQEPVTMRYESGIKLFILGERIRERFDILAVARDEMARLREQCGQAVTVSALAEGQVVVLDVLQARTVVNFGTQPGTVLDLHASAHGKVALAFGPGDLLQRCTGKALKALTPQTICTLPALQRAVEQVRSRGWATAPNQVLQGVNGLAAPIFNHVDAYAGAIAIVGSVQHIPPTPSLDQIAAVTEAAKRISVKLGWRMK